MNNLDLKQLNREAETLLKEIEEYNNSDYVDRRYEQDLETCRLKLLNQLEIGIEIKQVKKKVSELWDKYQDQIEKYEKRIKALSEKQQEILKGRVNINNDIDNIIYLNIKNR